MPGPLAGVTVIELTGIGPCPFAAMMLADMGARVVRVDRPGGGAMALGPRALDVIDRGRQSVAVDLKRDGGADVVLRLVERADALVEGYRPGVAERLGIGPDECLARNPALVYGRMTGWGQEGPRAPTAGHDIDYIALAGALAHFGRAGEKPTPPINMVGDFGGGGMFLAFGVVCGILEARASGQGQVIDAAMVDGAAALMAMIWGARAAGVWNEARGTNLIDTGAPEYDTYETADGHYIAVGTVEDEFYDEFLARIGLSDDPTLPDRHDPSGHEERRARFTAVFASKTRDEWCARFDGSDACVAPVLTMTEAAHDPHIRARGTIVERNGVLQPAPAPRFSRTPGALGRPRPQPGEHTDEILAEAGVAPDEIAALRAARVVA